MFTTQQKITSFFLRHPDFFIETISAFYPFSEAELQKYQHVINWDLIHENEAIDWNENMIRQFMPKLNWCEFSRNAAFAKPQLLESFKDQIDWKGEEDGFFCSIAANEAICWTPELIEKYKNQLNFNYLSMNEQVQWSEQLIDNYKDCWNWDNLMMNHSIPWTLPMLKKFNSYIDTSSFYFQAHPVLTSQLDILEAYPRHFLARAVCGNSKLPWKEKNLLMLWEEKLDWYALAGNETLFEDPAFFEDHLDKWLPGPDDKFEMLSKNKALPWSVPFIERFSDRWDWDYLSRCSHLPWTEELIDHFENYWEWGGEYTYNITEDEDGNRLPEPFPTGIGYSAGIDTNPYLPWSLDFIKKYENRLDINQLAANKGVWEKIFKPFVDESMVNTILRLI